MSADPTLQRRYPCGHELDFANQREAYYAVSCPVCAGRGGRWRQWLHVGATQLDRVNAVGPVGARLVALQRRDDARMDATFEDGRARAAAEKALGPYTIQSTPMTEISPQALEDFRTWQEVERKTGRLFDPAVALEYAREEFRRELAERKLEWDKPARFWSAREIDRYHQHLHAQDAALLGAEVTFNGHKLGRVNSISYELKTGEALRGPLVDFGPLDVETIATVAADMNRQILRDICDAIVPRKPKLELEEPPALNTGVLAAMMAWEHAPLKIYASRQLPIAPPRMSID